MVCALSDSTIRVMFRVAVLSRFTEDVVYGDWTVPRIFIAPKHAVNYSLRHELNNLKSK